MYYEKINSLNNNKFVKIISFPIFKEVHFTWLLPKDSALLLGKSGCCQPAVWRRVFRGTRRSVWGIWHTRRISWCPAPRRSASGRSVGWVYSWWRARERAARSGKRGSGRVPSCHPPLTSPALSRLIAPDTIYGSPPRPTTIVSHLRLCN